VIVRPGLSQTATSMGSMRAAPDAPSDSVRTSLACCNNLRVPNDVRRLSMEDLTHLVLGRAMSVDDAWVALLDEPADSGLADDAVAFDGKRVLTEALWVGSVGYERFRLNTDLAERLRAAGVERVIDVRQLPISRRPGYAKSALGQAFADAGIEYVHVRALGNPKPTRDLYKSGQIEEGRAGYGEYLVGEQRDALAGLVAMLREKRSALMCVEHDPATCHRTVIFEALGDELGIDLDVAVIA
jgi:Protein of unknown function, DUF488